MNIDWVDLFFKPSGRIGQKEFWIGVAILIVINIIISKVIPADMALVSSILGLLMIWPGYCVLSSRFKDMGKPPWIAILPYAITGVGYVLLLIGALGMAGGAAAGSDGAAVGGMVGAGLGVMAVGIGALINLIFFIWAGVSKGDPGPNAYGPPPGDPTAKA